MKRIVIPIAAGFLLAALASAQPGHNLLTYVLTNDPVSGAANFGVADLGSGGFLQVGPSLPPDLGHALMPAPGDGLLSLAFSGRLYKINERTGEASVVGATGLGDCTTPASPCGPNSANTLGKLDSRYYALDFSQTLYSVDPNTGSAKMIGPTGMPHINFVPLTIDGSNGKLNVYEESMFDYHGKLYANFDTGQIDLSNGSETAVIPAALYEIDPKTGHATMITPTDLGLLTIVTVDDTIYGFDAPHDRFVTIDLKTGHTQPASNFDPAGGFVCGAAPAHPTPK